MNWYKVTLTITRTKTVQSRNRKEALESMRRILQPGYTIATRDHKEKYTVRKVSQREAFKR